MRRPSFKLLSVLVLALAGIGLVSDRVLASTPTVKGKGKLFTVLNFNSEAITFNVNVAVVPEKQTVVLTDIVITNTAATETQFALRCIPLEDESVQIFGPVIVPPSEQFQHAFSTGIECPEGSTLQVTATDNDYAVSATGYFRKGS